MGFLQDLTNKAKNIASKGKSVILDQLSSETTYERDATGNFQMTSTTGNKPKLFSTVKEMTIPGRNYTDAQINAATPTGKEKITGIVKGAGEIVQGGLSVAHMLGNTIADTIVPGYDAEKRKAARESINTKVSEKLAPKTAGEAKVMRMVDILGFVAAPVKATKLSKLEEISSLAKNSLKNEKSGFREKSLDYFREDPKRVQEGEVRLREIEDGSIVIEDGRHRLEVGRETGIKPNIVDVTSEYTGKPSAKVAQLKMELEAQTIPPKKEFDIPRTATGDVDVKKFIDTQDAIRQSEKKSNKATNILTDFKNEVENKLVDFTAPILRAYNKGLADDLDFKNSQVNKANINDYIDRTLNTPSITKGFLKDNGFSDIVQQLDSTELKEFDQYLIARHGLDVRKNDVNVGMNRPLEADEALVRQLGPKYESLAESIDTFAKARRDYMVESGLLSKENAAMLEEKYPHYVPFSRVFNEDELVDKFGSKGVASLSTNTSVQKFDGGSDRAIESPLESFIELTSKMIAQGEKNKAAQTIVSYKDVKNNPFGLRRVTDDAPVSPDKDTISFFNNGKKETWEVNADIAKAAKALNVQQISILGQIFAAPVRTARIGISGISPAFTAANVVRDNISAAIFSDNGLRASPLNPIHFGKAVATAIKHDALYDEMISQGALMTSFDASRNAKTATLAALRSEKSRFANIVYNGKNPLRWIRSIEDVIQRSEEATRISQYKAAKEAALERGVDLETAKIIASRAARENSVNFARRGEYGTAISAAYLYLNASIQGSRLLVRNLKNKPAATSAKIITNLMFPAAALTYYNLSDPERKKVYDQLQDYEKDGNLILILPSSSEEGGRYTVAKIPLPPGVGEFAGMIRRPIEASYGLDEIGFGEAASRMLKAVQPIDLQNPVNSVTPQAVKLVVQPAVNQNLFTGNPIVPRGMQDKSPDRQFFAKEKGDNKNTSGTAKLIADNLGVSPIKTEETIKTGFGSVAKNILNISDKVLAKTGAIEEDQIGGEGFFESIGKRFNSAAGGKQDNETLNVIYDALEKSRSDGDVLSEKAFMLNEELKQLPKEEANALARKVKEEEPDLYTALKKEVDNQKKGFTQEESALTSLPVKDGTRAKVIKELSDKIYNEQGKEAANAYIKDLRDKKIISDDVLKQLKELRSTQE